MNNPTRVTPLQFFFIAVNIGFYASILALPSKVAEIAQEDMWLSVLLGIIPIMVALWVAMKLAAYFPDHIAVQYHRILLGNVAGTVLNIILVVLLILTLAVTVRIFIIAIRTYLLDLTPPMVTVSILLLPAIYVAQYGLMPILRMVQFLFLPGFGFFIMLLLLGFLSVDTANYLPMLANGVTPVLQGLIPTWFLYTGPELVVGLLYPFITRPRSLFRFGMAAILFLTTIYGLITVIIEGILGHEEIAHLLLPTLAAYRSVEIPDTFIERLDGYLLIILTIMTFCTTILTTYFIAFTVGKMINLEYSRPVVALLVPLLIYIVHLPPDNQTAEAAVQWATMLSLLWSFGVLPLLLLVAWYKEKRQSTC